MSPGELNQPVPESDQAVVAHDPSIGQPPDPGADGPVATAEVVAAQMSSEAAPMGKLGKPFNWKSPFFIGMAAAAGVAVTYGAIMLFLTAGSVLILIGLALFLAVGMEPAVSWLVRHRFPRWSAVLTVLASVVAIIVGFLATAVPALASQIGALAADVPGYLQRLNDKSSFIGGMNERFGIQEKLQGLLSSSGSQIATGVLGAGIAVFNALTDTLIVFVLTAYFLADLPRIRALFYRLVPHSRRPRTILIGDDIMAKVGHYVLGNLLISLIVGLLTFAWLIIFGVPYALLISFAVALLDLVPVIGAFVGGVIAALAALTVSLPIALATIAFFIVYHLAEDYFLIPAIIGRAVQVPALVTVVAVLIGGALLGVIGALVAIPIAAALLLVMREILFPRLDSK